MLRLSRCLVCKSALDTLDDADNAVRFVCTTCAPRIVAGLSRFLLDAIDLDRIVDKLVSDVIDSKRPHASHAPSAALTCSGCNQVDGTVTCRNKYMPHPYSLCRSLCDACAGKGTVHP